MKVFTIEKQIEAPPAISVLAQLEQVLVKLVLALSTSGEITQVTQMVTPGANISRQKVVRKAGPFSSPHRLRVLSQTCYLLNVIHKLVSCNRQVTQRELFYRSLSDLNAPTFGDQSVLNRALLSLMDTVGCDRHTLGVFTSARGLVVARPRVETLCLDELGEFVANISDHPDGLAISESLMSIRTIQTSAQYVLVVEKETVFQSFLASERFFDFNECIMVTARGFPDNITIRFLRLMDQMTHLPVYYLGDLDPHGVCIYLTYVRSLDSRCVWLGLRYGDVMSLSFNSLVGLKMKAGDLAVLNGLLEREDTPAEVKSDLEKLETRGLKFEVECLHSVGEFYLANEWLPARIVQEANLLTI